MNGGISFMYRTFRFIIKKIISCILPAHDNRWHVQQSQASGIQTVTGNWLTDFFYREFAEPLGIRYYHINIDDFDSAYMEGGIQMKARGYSIAD